MNRPMLLSAMICLGFAAPVCGQGRVRGHVFLPHTHGATVLSTHINAQANRLVALGDFLESAAIARRINVLTDREVMKNSVLWVETYFERRRLNREYRDAERLDYAESQLQIANLTHNRIVQGGSYGDYTDEINFMMDQLNVDASAYRAIFLDDLPPNDAVDLELSPNDLAHILLQEKGSSSGGRPFRPTKPEIIDSRWPKVFLRPEFDAVRAEYDAARQRAIKEIASGDLSIETNEALHAALGRVEKQFEDFYDWKRMKGSVDLGLFCEYRKAGESFLRTQAAGSLRAFAMSNPDTFMTDMQFDGDTLVDLVRYCSQKNLEFARPKPGDEATYSDVYQQMRQLYLEYYPDLHSLN